jgi:hypothetical protein
MAQIIRLRRSSVSGQKPTNSNLELGELALNTTDGKAFMSKSGSLGASIEELIITNASNTGSINLSGSINLLGNQTITGSLIVTDGLGYIDTGLIAQNSDLILTSGSNIYVQNGGIVSASQIQGDGSQLINIPISGVTNLEIVTASIIDRLEFLEAETGSISNIFNVFSSSYSTGSFTGSFKGDGSQLYNVPASGITNLNLTLISDGNATASISNTEGLRINRNTEITGSLIVSSGSATFDATLALTENSSLILNSGSNLYVYDGGIISGTFKGNGALLTDLTYATTGSNTFYGTQIFTGSVYITEDLIVLGSSSLQNITASSVDIGTNTINLNTFLPSVRYGGINVFDSGSSGVSASLLWDSQTDNWIFVHEPVGGPTDSSYFMYGPLSQDGVGSENILDGNYLTKVENNGHGHHLTTSSLFDNGLKVSINSNTEITGSFLTTGTIVSQTTPLVSGSSQIQITGTTGYSTFSSSLSSSIGELSSSVASINLGQNNRLDSIEGVTSSLNTFSSSINTTIKNKLNSDGVISGSSQVIYSGLTGIPSGIVSGSSQISDFGFAITGSNTFYGSQTINGDLTASLVSASFKGDASQLYNIPISGITNFELDKIVSGNVSASISPENGFRVNTDTTIDGDLNVNGTITAKEIHVDFVTSSVLYESGSTRFGDTFDDNHSFTGSVNITGSLTLNNDSVVVNTDFNNYTGSVDDRLDNIEISTGSLNSFTSSYATGSFTGSFNGDGSGLTNVGQIETVFYVSEDGNDVNDGKTLSTSFRTIKAAINATSASLALNPGLPVHRQSVQVKSGYYVEEAPITVPSNVSILGDDLRSVVIRPTTGTKTENLFLMNNGTYCWGLRLEGCEIDDLDDPRKGFFFAFAPGAYIVTSPYIQNCSAISTPADKFYAPLDYVNNNPLVGNGPGGMIIDDSVLDGYSPLKSMIIDAYTQVAFNGVGICVRGRGYGQLVSFFTNFSSTGVFCIDGGHASLLNSNTTFGDYGLRAQGLRMLVKPDISAVSSSVDISGSLLVSANKTNIQEYMTQKLLLSGSYKENYYSGSMYCYTDSGVLVDSIAADLLVPKASRTSQFTQGLFKGQDITTGSIYTLPIASGSSFTQGAITIIPQISNASGSLTGDFVLAWQYMKEYIISDPASNFTTLSTPARNKIGQMFDVVINTVTAVVVNGAGKEYLEEFGSLITSTSHDFSYAGAGVNFLSLPINQGGVGETNVDIRIFEEGGGRVFHTSGDETGDFYAGNDFIIRQATGTIEGRTFSKALSAQFTPLNLALEG